HTIPATYRPNRPSVADLVIEANTGRVVSTSKPQGYWNENNIVKESALSIHPNPTRDVVNLQMIQSGEFAVKIYDLTGKEVLNRPATQFNESSTLSIPVSSLSEGTYIISVEGEGQSFSKKLVIK